MPQVSTEESHPIFICITCGVVLHNLREGERKTPIHPPQYTFDHEPVAVEVDETYKRLDCDFCIEERASWILPARTFTNVLGMDTTGNWAACHTCAGLVERGQWKKLEYRLRDQLVRKLGRVGAHPTALSAAREDWRRLRRNIIGPMRPVGVTLK
jgi:hypothetical protein